MTSNKMEYTRKFKLVSIDGKPKSDFAVSSSSAIIPTTVSSMHSQKAQTARDEMIATLKRNDLTGQQKLMRYNQYQYEYANHRREMSKPVKINIRDHSAEDEENYFLERQKPRSVLSRAVTFFQKSYRENAIGFGEFLLFSQTAANIKWNERGEIIINDQIIHGSNLQTLMDDVLRKRVSRKPIGYREFATALKQANLPQNIVGETSGVYKTGDYSSDNQLNQDIVPDTRQLEVEVDDSNVADYPQSAILTTPVSLSVDGGSSSSSSSNSSRRILVAKRLGLNSKQRYLPYNPQQSRPWEKY
jgi:hypothetical protein